MTLVIDETKSYAAVFQSERLEALIYDAIDSTMRRNSFRKIKLHQNQEMSISLHQNERSNSSVPTALPSSRIVSGKQMKCVDLFPAYSHRKVGDSTIDDVTSLECKSPFTNIFLQDSLPCKKSFESPEVDFEDAFMVTHEHNIKEVSDTKIELSSFDATVEEIPYDSMAWTRTRLKAIKSEISDLGVNSGAVQPITVTKEMLSKAQYVAQLDAKYIIIKCGSLLCAVDQHAADERIGLERLEAALSTNLSGDKCSLDLTKMGKFSSDDLIKPVVLRKAQSIFLSSTQLATAKDKHKILSKWRFRVEIPKEGSSEVLLHTVPGILNKIASPKDFLQFIQALGSCTSDASLVKPAFVKRVLSSFACRYAVMFGDVLSDDNCNTLIFSLSQCNLSFICAHGRYVRVCYVS